MIDYNTQKIKLKSFRKAWPFFLFFQGFNPFSDFGWPLGSDKVIWTDRSCSVVGQTGLFGIFRSLLKQIFLKEIMLPM